MALQRHRLSPPHGYVRVAALHSSRAQSSLVIRAGDSLMMIAKPERCFVLVLLVLSVCIYGRPLDAASEGAMKKVAIVPFDVPSAAADREWLGDGLPHVLALRLQHLPQLKVTVLSHSMLSDGEGRLNVFD